MGWTPPHLLGNPCEKDRAREILAPILDGFTAGLDTEDVNDTRTLHGEYSLRAANAP